MHKRKSDGGDHNSDGGGDGGGGGGGGSATKKPALASSATAVAATAASTVVFPFVSGGALHLLIGGDVVDIILSYCDAAIVNFTSLHRPLSGTTTTRPIVDQLLDDYTLAFADTESSGSSGGGGGGGSGGNHCGTTVARAIDAVTDLTLRSSLPIGARGGRIVDNAEERLREWSARASDGLDRLTKHRVRRRFMFLVTEYFRPAATIANGRYATAIRRAAEAEFGSSIHAGVRILTVLSQPLPASQAANAAAPPPPTPAPPRFDAATATAIIGALSDVAIADFTIEEERKSAPGDDATGAWHYDLPAKTIHVTARFNGLAPVRIGFEATNGGAASIVTLDACAWIRVSQPPSQPRKRSPIVDEWGGMNVDSPSAAAADDNDDDVGGRTLALFTGKANDPTDPKPAWEFGGAEAGDDLHAWLVHGDVASTRSVLGVLQPNDWAVVFLLLAACAPMQHDWRDRFDTFAQRVCEQRQQQGSPPKS